MTRSIMKYNDPQLFSISTATFFKYKEIHLKINKAINHLDNECSSEVKWITVAKWFLK